jgi:hypothetical protein
MQSLLICIPVVYASVKPVPVIINVELVEVSEFI